MAPAPLRETKALTKWVRQAVSEGDFATAEKVSRQALQEDASDYELRNLRGLALGKLRRFDEALAEHAEAIGLVDTDPIVWHNYGVTLSERSTIDRDTETANKAVDAFTKALSLNPAQFPSYVGLVTHYMEMLLKTDRRNKAAIEARANDVVDRMFRVSPDVVMPMNVGAIAADKRLYMLRQRISVDVHMEAHLIVCEFEALDLYGDGESFTRAWDSLCDYFDVIYREYVEVDDPLHDGALSLAQRLETLVEKHLPPLDPVAEVTQ